MRNLINFLIKYSFIFVFLLLEIIAFILLVSNNSYQRSAYVSASNGVTANMQESVSNIANYIGLEEENQKLAAENAFLRSQLLESNLWAEGSLSTHIDSNKTQFYTYIQAQIISNSFQNRNNYIILDKGSDDGIEVEMGVISTNGIVGIVNSVNKNFCSIISILHAKSAIDAKITSNKYTGTCYWPGENYQIGQLKNIPSHAVFSVGDTLVTSGNSSVFPPEIPIGFIHEFELKPGRSFYEIQLKYSADYNKLNHVYIIHNLLKEQLKEIKEVRDDG
ncbi:MAG: rod shape-determining protein MreC [Bacteroidales bacterium]|nr:rod shape-determining protein MreC [Bacteroidales bacterium]